jgi:hypothetical protein
LAGTAVEFAEADVAVGKERAHPELAGERQGCTVVVLRVSCSPTSTTPPTSPAGGPADNV